MATSVIKGGIEEFTLTRNSSIASGGGKGIYDRRTGVVRISLQFNNGSTAIPTTTNLFTIPTEYAPKEVTGGIGLIWNGAVASPSMSGASYFANTEGGIRQSASNNTSRGFAYIEYVI